MFAVELRCESQTEPLGIDVPSPRLSWVLEAPKDAYGITQTAYQVLVARSAKALSENRGDLWDSGRVESRKQNNIAYQGTGLKAGDVCYWKVRTWDSNGKSEWSNPSRWEMGPMQPEDWKGQWINDGKAAPKKDADFYKDDPAPLFRKEFPVRKQLKRARLAISGLGYYEASLNGALVGDHVLDPGWTRVEKRVLYSVYDVTTRLKPGDNCIGVMLGNGWYNPLPLRLFGSFNLREHLSIGRPRLIAQLALEYADGTTEFVATDPSWKVSEGPLLRNNVYLGEVYDATKEQAGWNKAGFKAEGWRDASLATEKLGPLRSQSQPPIRRGFSNVASKVTSPKPGVYIFDLGSNFAGWVKIRPGVPAGRKVQLRYGELLNKDGTLNPMTSVAGQIKYKRQETGESVGGPGAPEVAVQEDSFISNGPGFEYESRFTFRGFRYVEVTGLESPPKENIVTGVRLYSDVPEVGTFESSNALLNSIQQICDTTFKSNIFSVQSDCPHREKLGYGGDIVATSEAFMANYDMSQFYTKATRDWVDSALPDGMFTDTAPFMGIHYCGVVWAMTPVLLSDQLYRYYGDLRIGAEQYEAAKTWLAQVQKKFPDGIVTDGLSDHEGLEPNPSPEMVTPFYFWSAQLLAKTAQRLGKKEDADRFELLANNVQKVYLNKFFDSVNGKVGTGSQANQSIALQTQIVPEEHRAKVLEYLIARIHDRNDHLSTGILGTNAMFDALSESGNIDLAYKIATQTDFPSWGWMLKNGATTLWEHWALSENTFSHNHPMFGSISRWFTQWLGGIQPDPEAVGYDRIVIRPQVPKDLDRVRVTYRSAIGPILSAWTKEGGKIRFEIEIPPNGAAKVVLPKGMAQVVEPKKPIKGAEYSEKEAAFKVGAGRYVFVIQSE